MATAQLGVPRQRCDRVLDAGPAGVLNADDRAADHRAPLHQPGHFATEHFADGALEHRLVVGEHPDRAAVDHAVAGDDAVAEQGVGVVGRPGQRTDLQERTGIDQGVDARAGTRNALFVAFGDGLLTAGFFGQLQLFAKFGQQLGGGLGAHLAAFAGAAIVLIASVMWAPTLAMIGSSMAWMCSPPI